MQRRAAIYGPAMQTLTQLVTMLAGRGNLRLDTALNNISQGLCFFDGNQRLIVCNKRYVEMYGLPPERVAPGMTLREIVDLRFAAGSCPKTSVEEYVAW